MTSSVHGVLAERRHQLILRVLRSGGPAAVTDLSEQLGVSPATVRRDLVKLEEDGLLTRLHGGMVRREYRSLVGFLTEDNLRQLHADWLFLGTSGVRPGGQVMDTTVVEVPVKRAMINASDKVVLLADTAKFPGTGMAKVCGPEELD